MAAKLVLRAFFMKIDAEVVKVLRQCAALDLLVSVGSKAQGDALEVCSGAAPEVFG